MPEAGSPDSSEPLIVANVFGYSAVNVTDHLKTSKAEANDRLQRKVERHLKDANLPAGKNLESLDQQKLPEKVRRQLTGLLEADFVRRGDNLLCFGIVSTATTASGSWAAAVWAPVRSWRRSSG